jgi:hypothetical protein
MRDREKFAEAALAETNRLHDITEGLRELLAAAAAAELRAAGRSHPEPGETQAA